MKLKRSTILQELESDDELPYDYNDVSILPAYLDDYRFDEIKFPWLIDVGFSRKDTKLKCNVLESQSHVIIYHEGILKCQDLYCLKSVELLSCSSTLIWFVNFLLRKDLQSHYKYMKSCLVGNDLIYTLPFTKNDCNTSEDVIDKDQYEIVVKD